MRQPSVSRRASPTRWPTKSVAFLVTRDEYERLRSECAAGAARTMPELIRAKLLPSINSVSAASVATRLDELEHVVHSLRRVVEAKLSADRCGVPHGR